MSIDFSKFDPKQELDVQRNLFKECFPECIDTPVVTNEHYNWKFHSKKGTFKSPEYSASSTEGMLGYYAAIPYQYRFEGKVLNAAMVCDVMTGVKARGKGVFTKLGIYATNEFANQGFDFSTGYPIRKEVIPGHIKAGWEINFELPLYGRLIKFDSLLKKKKLGFLAPVLNLFLKIITGFLNFILITRNENLKTTTFSSNEITNIQGLSAFYEEWSNEIEISLVKDLEFLKWRLTAPEKEYSISVLTDNNKIVGVLIAREVLKEGVPCMGILDMAILKEYHKYSNFLTNELINVAKLKKAELLLIMMSSTWFKNYKLAQNLFIKTPFKFYLIIKQLNQVLNFDKLKQEKNWHLMWIDSDDL